MWIDRKKNRGNGAFTFMKAKESGSRKRESRIKLYPLAAFLCFFLACIGDCGNRAMAAATNGQEQGEFEGSIREEELEAQISEYYDAVSKRDIRRAETLAGTESRQRAERYEGLWMSGLEAIDVLDVIAYPCEEYRIVVISYEIEIEGVETKAPGAEMLVAKQTDGRGFILLFSESMEQELPEDDQEIVRQKIKEIMENQDILDFFEEVNQGYLNAKEDSGLREWEESWLMEQDRVLQEKAEVSAVSYVVKKGDCLWSIAGNMMGDSTKWDAIYEKNKDVIGEDPGYIMPGMELEIP